uniref:diguanylate cyclase domain-containing protein n=1 Tax=Amphritea sp. TaxID=1872502 RepID=UPI003D0AA0DA
IINSDGESRWYLLHIDGIVEEGYLTGCWGISRDVTERHQYWFDLEFQANHDSLTLLPNRKALYTDMETRLANLASGKGGSCVALMLIDLDRFKEINDTLGHHMGDRLLKQLGPRLKSVISEDEGLVARLGGDEFAIVVTRQNEAEALDKAFKVLMAIKGTFELGGFRTD